MQAVPLPDRAVVSLSGAEAQGFLQNVVTADVDALGAGEAKPCALLSPQGKILFDFLVSRNGSDALRLDCRAAAAADLARRLTLYRLRAKVAISVDDQPLVSVCWLDESGGSESHASGIDIAPAVRDLRFPAELGVRRAYGAAPGGSEAAAWDALRVTHGVAESPVDFMPGDAFPHDVLLDQNGGVGFRKGCFIGQEVVSRMQHRGTARRRILVAEGDALLPAPGTEVTAGGRVIGTLGTVAGRRALALLRVDRVADAVAAGEPVLAGGASLALSVPPGMRFTLPEPGQPAAAG